MSSGPQPPLPASKITLAPPEVLLRALYRKEFESIRHDFEATGSGLASLSERTRLVEKLASGLWQDQLPPSQGCALLAVGGFGRSELFPHSDVDLLFLVDNEGRGEEINTPVKKLCQTLWDSGLRVSPAVRSVAECARFDPANLEFTLSVLDCRLIAGDTHLFERLRERELPQLVARESDAILLSLSDLTRARHQRFGDTIFHLEPDLKNGPGGLRDCHVSQWVGLIFALSAERGPEVLAARKASEGADEIDAIAFLTSARCYLHYRNNRDDNAIDWAAQEEMATRGIGTESGPVSAAEWMRLYFRHARAVHRGCTQLLDQIARRRSSLLRSFQHWRSRLSNQEFSVVDGQVYFQQTADAREAAAVLRLFIFLARHGLAVSGETERRLDDNHRRLVQTMPQNNFLWRHLREMLALPHAAAALRTMHSLNLLTHAVPEFEAIDSLVLRDLYHRYTVDEHTFMAIDALHRLTDSAVEWLQPFRQLMSEVERPELLFLALLLHDVGKGLEGADHAQSSLLLATAAVERMELGEEDAQLVLFLVAHHLEMSSTLRRRDIFDPATIRELAGKIGTPERLKMLTLMTLADINAVNPEALTAWKAENLWRLCMGTATYFDRSADRGQLEIDNYEQLLTRVVGLLPNRRPELAGFLQGLPQRYLLSHSSEQVAQQFTMASHLSSEPVQVGLRPSSGQQELTVLTQDRAGLFCTLAGILFGWGMDIVKAAAFSNDAGVVVDSFYFKDRYRTLELNPPERERFKRSIREILQGEASLDALLQSRLKADLKAVKLAVETRLRYDNECSARSTLLEVVTQDRPGLLHIISSALSNEGCSIEIALIHTEGPVAHDVFYLTRGGKKLSAELMREIEWGLATELGDSLPTSW